MGNEDDILNAALRQLKLNTGIDANHIQHGHHRERYDATLILEEIQFVVEIKRAVLARNTGVIINQVKALAEIGEPLFVGEYINNTIGAQLRDARINYLDTAGNAYLNRKPLYILIKGNPKPKEMLGPVGQAFTPSGLKAIFALLAYPGLVIGGTQRDIAGLANIALGAVGAIIKDLTEKEFLRQEITNNRRRWNEQKIPELIDKWTEEYPKLKKKLFLGRYIARDHLWWKNNNPEQYGAELGGEIAGGEYTHHLKPQIATVYIDKKEKNKFLKAFRLAKATDASDTEGMLVEVFEKFWNQHDTKTGGRAIAHPLIVYADLIATADMRNIETARILRDNHIEKLIYEMIHAD
jgi:hypothetical protein